MGCATSAAPQTVSDVGWVDLGGGGGSGRAAVRRGKWGKREGGGTLCRSASVEDRRVRAANSARLRATRHRSTVAAFQSVSPAAMGPDSNDTSPARLTCKNSQTNRCAAVE